MPSENETSPEEMNSSEEKLEKVQEEKNIPTSNDCVAKIIAYSPETKPRLWLWINSACLAFAIVMTIVLSQYDAEDVNFPTSSYLFYSVTVSIIWCVEAGSSIMAVDRSDKGTFYFVCLELIIAIYYGFSMIYLIARQPHFSKSDKASSVPDTEIDVVFYFLSCCYNVYQIRTHHGEHSVKDSSFGLSGEINQNNSDKQDSFELDKHELNVKSDVEMV